jgi:hypothetical protein
MGVMAEKEGGARNGLRGVFSDQDNNQRPIERTSMQSSSS